MTCGKCGKEFKGTMYYDTFEEDGEQKGRSICRSCRLALFGLKEEDVPSLQRSVHKTFNDFKKLCKKNRGPKK